MPHIPRRGFLQAGASSGLALAACARASRSPAGPVPLTREQLAELEAIAARILPSDDGTPGAREAGVVGFIERALTTFWAERRPLVEAGLADLGMRAGGLFAALPAERQDAILRDIEKSPFFEIMRLATIIGMFADPSYGGNRAQAGWKLLGFDPRGIWQPPFGAYDAAAGANE